MCSEDDDFIYQLRHMGPPPSCEKVPRIMRLNFGVTKIGRGQSNDFFLDSLKLKNFISRYHAEIVGSKNENGEVEFVLTDKGLNGTFINDYRTQKTCALEIGDKITFGHTNGYKIQPGFYASQPESEFQFVFEQLPKSSRTAEFSSDNFNREESTDAATDQKLYSERGFLKDSHSNIQSPHITSTQDPPKDIGSDAEDSKSAVINKSISPTKGSSKTLNTKEKKKSLDSIASQENKTDTKVVKETVSKQKDTSALAETLPAEEHDSDSESESDGESDSDKNEEEEDEDQEEEDKQEDKEESEDDGKVKGKDKDDDEEEEEEVEDEEEEMEEEEEEESVSEEEAKPKPKPKIKRPPPPSKRKVTRSALKPKPKPEAKIVKEDVISFSEESSEDDIQKQVSDVLALINTTSESDTGIQVQKEEPVKPPTRGQRTRNKSGSSTTSTAAKPKASQKRKPAPAAAGSRNTADTKRRRTRGKNEEGDKEKEKDLSDGVEWYEEDTCDAPDCKRPKKKRTPWVQCDDCDGWYHTVCVGANYRQVKDDNASFSCGCT